MDKLMDVVMLTVHSPLIVAPLNGKEIYARPVFMVLSQPQVKCMAVHDISKSCSNFYSCCLRQTNKTM